MHSSHIHDYDLAAVLQYRKEKTVYYATARRITVRKLTLLTANGLEVFYAGKLRGRIVSVDVDAEGNPDSKGWKKHTKEDAYKYASEFRYLMRERAKAEGWL